MSPAEPIDDSGSDVELQNEAQDFLNQISDVVTDPTKIAELMGSWFKAHMPARLSSAAWIDVDGNRDTGLNVRIYEHKLSRWPTKKIQLGALLGKKSAGLDVTAEVFQMATGARVSLGVGVVTPFDNIGHDLQPVAVLSVRF